MELVIFSAFIFVAVITFKVVTDLPKSITQSEFKLGEYQVRHRLMNNSESSFYYLLKEELPDEYNVFPKMRIADILKPIHGKGYYKRRNHILPKHVDFVVCNHNLKPIAAFEIDGKSHEHSSRKERDQLVEKIFRNAGLKLWRVKVGSNFKSTIVEIVKSLD